MTSSGAGGRLVDAAFAYAAAHPVLGPEVGHARAALRLPRAQAGLSALAVPFVREHLAAPAALQDLRDLTSSTWTALTSAAPPAYDVVVVGGGVVAAAVAKRLGARGVRALVVDEHEGGGPFSRFGATFRLNTWNAPGDGPARIALENELHPGLDVPLSWLTGARLPSADVLGHAALVTLARADVHVLTSSCCTRIEDGPRGARLRLQRDGAAVDVDTAGVILIPGMGRARRIPHPRDQRIQTAEEILAAATTARDAQAFFRPGSGGHPVVVAGAGPSALALLALAYGHAPLGVLDGEGHFARTRGARPSILWVTGETGPRSAVEALAQWEATPAPHTMPAVLATQAATVLWDLVHAESAGALVVRRGRVLEARQAPDAIDVVLAGDVVRAARLALAIGYEGALDVLEDLARSLVPVHGRVPESDTDVVIALQSPELPIHVTGAVLEGRVPPNPVTGPLADHVGRALAVAEIVPSRGVRRSPAAVERRDIAGRGAGSATVDVPAAHVSTSWSVTLPFDVGLALAPFTVGRRRRIDVELAPRADRMRVVVEGVSRAGAAAIAARLSARARAAVLSLGGMRVRLDVDRGGRPLVSTAALVVSGSTRPRRSSR